MEEQKTESVQTLFDKVAHLIAENLVAICEKGENALYIRSVGGKTYRMTMEEV
ncbi:MAG: hypothetical protein IJX18_00380 [Clostridia bacterium]|nr:hypothetical protein [Clostridia bacterium]